MATAHRAGLKVHAWVNVNLVSDAQPPAARGHLVYTHPEWLMVPRPLAADLARMNPRSPEYLQRLSEYAKARSDRVEGLFLSPVHKGSVDHTVKVIGDIASRYDVDGIHLDYIRFPNDEFDYSAATLEAFRSDVLSSVSRAERREYARRASGRPLFYTEMFPQRWQEFRRARLTALLDENPVDRQERDGRDAMLSAAVFPDATDATTRRFQDWGGWLETGLLDAICPMAYTDRSRAVPRADCQRRTARRAAAGVGGHRRVSALPCVRPSKTSEPLDSSARRASFCSRTTT